jgi:tetratricopeptide (TPR) repeat protein
MSVQRLRIRICRGGFALALASLLAASLALAGQDPPATDAPLQTVAPTNGVTIDHLREQHRATLQAIEQLRTQNEEASRRAVDALAARLATIEHGLNATRTRELELLRNTGQLMVWLAAVVGVVACGAMAATVVLLVRLKGRQGNVPVPVAYAPALMSSLSPAAALTAGETHLVTVNPAEQSSARFLGAMDRLEERLKDLERTASRPGQGGGARPETTPRHGAPPDASMEPETLPTRGAILLARGQALLNLDQAEDALACFAQAADLEPDNAEVHVKRGLALERLRRHEEALSSYDQAIALDSGATMAYLHKAGVFNRLERYNDALACYERALHTRDTLSDAPDPARV